MRSKISVLIVVLLFVAIPAMAQIPGVLAPEIAKRLQPADDAPPPPPVPGAEGSPSDLLRDPPGNAGEQDPNAIPAPSMSGRGPGTKPGYGQGKIDTKGCDAIDCDSCDAGGPKGGAGGSKGGKGKLADLLFDSGDNQISKVQSMLPIIAVDTIGPTQVNVGKRTEFTIKVKNIGKTDARGVVVEAVLPKHARIVQLHPQPQQLTSGRLQYRIDEIPAKMGVKLAIEVIPEQTGQIDIETSYSVSTASNTSIAVTKPSLKMEANGTEDTVFGRTVDHTVVVTNSGNGVAENITVTANLPEGWKLTEGYRLSERVTRISAGKSQKFHFVTQALSDGPREVTYQVYIDSKLQTSVTKQVQVRRSQIESQVVGPDMNYLDLEGTYAISVDNVGDADANNVRISVTLPEGLRLVAAETKATFDKQLRTLTWELPVLSASEIHIVRFKAKGTSEGRHVQRIIVREDNQITDQLSYTTDVISRPRLSVTLEDKSGPVRIGEPLLLEVAVANDGTKAAEEVSIKVLLPRSMGAKNSSQYDVDDKFIVYPVFRLAAGERKVLQFESIGLAPGEEVIRVIMQSDTSRHQVLMEGSVLVFSTKRNENTARQHESLDKKLGLEEADWRQR